MLREQVISDEAIRLFRSEGAAVLKNLLSEQSLALLERGFDEVAGLVVDTNIKEKRDGRRVLMKEGTARCSANVARFLRESPAGQAAAAAMGSTEVRLYEDLLFVKETDAAETPTPWHQDSSHWPVKGTQMCSIWVSLEPTTLQTGAMTMVTGSHKGPLYTPDHGTVPSFYHHLIIPEAGGPLPNPDATPDAFPAKCYETERGDAVIFHPGMLHNAPGLAMERPRRTFTFRLLGDDITWFNRPIVMQEHIRALDLADGAPVAAGFPVIWPPERQTI
jgi:ectoine hydroxylase-related dioxygenase (phytanoyl-CoA dioxygenase family)